MKKRMIALVCAAMMLVSSALATNGGDLKASDYLDSFLVQVVSKGGGAMSVSYGVYGTGKIAKLGVKKIVVEEEVAKDRWMVIETYTDADHDDFYSYNVYSHLGSVSFRGLPGTAYRATITVYGGPTSGTGDSRSTTSLATVCK